MFKKWTWTGKNIFDIFACMTSKGLNFRNTESDNNSHLFQLVCKICCCHTLIFRTDFSHIHWRTKRVFINRPWAFKLWKKGTISVTLPYRQQFNNNASSTSSNLCSPTFDILTIILLYSSSKNKLLYSIFFRSWLTTAQFIKGILHSYATNIHKNVTSNPVLGQLVSLFHLTIYFFMIVACSLIT